MVKEAMKGLRSTNWQLQNCHWEVEYSIENVVNNIAIIMYGARRVRALEVSGSVCGGEGWTL